MSIWICEACGNPFDVGAEVVHPHARRVYDPYECAIHPAVPRCPRCGCPAPTIESAEEAPDHASRPRTGVAHRLH